LPIAASRSAKWPTIYRKVRILREAPAKRAKALLAADAAAGIEASEDAMAEKATSAAFHPRVKPRDLR
jgi:hypothetical protein